MNDALAMCFVESIGDLRRDCENLIEWQRPLLQPCRQRLSLQIRHDDEMRAVEFADVVDPADVRMIERGHGAGLPLEAAAQIWVEGDVGPEHFDRDGPIETGIAGAIDLTHSTRAERRSDFVRAKPSAVRKLHGQRAEF